MNDETGWILAARICRQRNGKLVSMPAVMRYGEPIPVPAAIKLIELGKTAFVRREDASEVLKAFEAQNG